MELTKKFNIGDKVFINKEYKDCEIVEVEKSSRFTIKGKKLVEGKWIEIENFKLDIFQINRIEDEKFSEISNEIRTKKDEWEKIIDRRNHDFKVCDLYKKLYEEQLELVPFYQRDYVWSLEQKLAYIRAVFEKEIETKPTLILNYKYEEKHENLKRYEVLDGKQRLKTLFDLVEDKLILWNGKKFSELSFQDKKHILNHTIRYTQIKKRDLGNLTEVEKVELFLEINELGTKMSDEHIKNIKEKYL